MKKSKQKKEYHRAMIELHNILHEHKQQINYILQVTVSKTKRCLANEDEKEEAYSATRKSMPEIS